MKLLSKKISYKIILTFFVVFYIFSKNDFHYSKYYIGKFTTYLFQKEYDYSTYYQFKVPKDWFYLSSKDGYNIFLGPTWNKEKKFTVIKVFTDMEKLRHNYQHFNLKYCTNLDTIIEVENMTSVTSDKIKILKSPAKIIFCNNSENNDSYVSYENAVALTHMVLKPYESKYHDKYVKIFQNIDYKISIDEIPKWAK